MWKMYEKAKEKMKINKRKNTVIPLVEMRCCAIYFWMVRYCTRCLLKFSNLLYSYHVRNICCLSFFTFTHCGFEFISVAISLYSMLFDSLFTPSTLRLCVCVCLSTFIPFLAGKVIKIPEKKQHTIHCRKYSNVLFCISIFLGCGLFSLLVWMKTFAFHCLANMWMSVKELPVKIIIRLHVCNNEKALHFHH